MNKTAQSPRVTTPEAPAIQRPAVNPDVVSSVEPSTLEDSHVYLHCHFNNEGHQETLVRIWSTSCLIDNDSGASSSLVHVENISMAPQWTRIPDHTAYTFLLIFTALPKSCQRFDFKENIAQPGGFFVPGIARNETDVYHVDV